jgi:GNAT superfamily N-acetyltransferase
MSEDDYLLKTPWDSAVFGIDTYELKSSTREALEYADTVQGHLTVRVDPLISKALLHEFGYYYCDTLLEPYCCRSNFVAYHHDNVGISTHVPLEELLAICDGAFEHGRFHRDFNLDVRASDRRYNDWLQQLYCAHTVFSLLYENEVAGFFAFDGNRIVLHALAPSYRGKRLAKYLWSVACVRLYDSGHDELQSSVSVSNLAVVNLYASLGFRFRGARDIYHKLNG